MMQHWIPLILFSSLFLSIYDMAKKQSVRENHVMEVLFLATASGTLFFIVMLAVSGKMGAALSITPLHLFLIAGKALLVASSWIFAYYAMRALPISIVAPIRASAPLWTLLAALILFREIPSLMQACGMGLIIIGYLCFSLAGRAEGISFARNRGVLYVFLGTILGAMSAIYDKFLLQKCAIARDPFQLWSSLFILIVLGFVWMVQRKFRLERTPFHWRWTIPWVGILLTLADWFYFAALSQDGVAISILSMIRRSSVVLSFTAGAILFHERNFKKKTPALLAILAGVFLLCLAR